MQSEADKNAIGGAAALEAAPPVQPQSKAEEATQRPLPDLRIALLTGGQDPHYAVGLGTALMHHDVSLDVIGSNAIDAPEFRDNPRARFLNLHGGQLVGNLPRRMSRILLFYARICRYTLTAKPKVFHILWDNKLQLLDRTLLLSLYKLAGKKVAFTAHNVNAGRRDHKDSWLNRITLRCEYKLVDQIFVHTQKMKDELVKAFDVSPAKITVIPYGINNAVPYTELTREQARRQLGLHEHEKVILYFGAIKVYKGLEYLVEAFQKIAADGDYRLIIAGERKKGYEEYWQSIQQMIERGPCHEKILQKIEFIPDAETEIYFKAADVAALSYTEIFQSGILFMAYAYGLPVVATDVGSFSEDIVEGKTGYTCLPKDADDMARTLVRYFESDLYRELSKRREEIRDFAYSSHSWDVVADMTRSVYEGLIEGRQRSA
ncbi:MAG TPA: glycosyltransferase family 4 protein [Terracidiphilus sp.]|nr:glycosyltransferase family 4 protein [Terracidiphilus sp.]